MVCIFIHLPYCQDGRRKSSIMPLWDFNNIVKIPQCIKHMVQGMADGLCHIYDLI